MAEQAAERTNVGDEERKMKLEAQIKSADMSEDMQQIAVETAQDAMEKYSIEKVRKRQGPTLQWVSIPSINSAAILQPYASPEPSLPPSGTYDIAMAIKKEFDIKFGATWHCIVGRNFGSFVTHETKHFIYFYLGHNAILLFKTQ